MRTFKKRIAGQRRRYDLVAVPWFAPEHYETIRDIVLDGQLLPFDYDTWHETYKLKHRDLQRQKLSPVRVNVDPDAFLSWCAGKGIYPNSESLSHFCHIHMSRQVEQPPRGNIKG